MDSEKNLSQHDTSHAYGLTQLEAEVRQKKYGFNIIPIEKRPSYVRIFFAQFNNILIYILLISACMTAIMQHWIDTIVIFLAVIINALIGFFQAHKAENALLEIRKLLSLKARVIRDGQSQMIDTTMLVPGDVVMIEAGDKVPADIQLFKVHDLAVQESILTGEALDVQKFETSTAPNTDVNANLSDRTSMIYSGTLVIRGQGTGVVTAIGNETEIGRISTLLKTVAPPITPLAIKINHFARWLTLTILILAFGVFLFGFYIRHLPLYDMFLIMIGIAVAAIPEGLPAAISIILALGVSKMAKRNAIVRNQPVIESLGNVTVICTDKTGTLTLNELTVSHIVLAKQTIQMTGVGYTPIGKFLNENQEISPDTLPNLQELLHAGVLNNSATVHLKNGEWKLSGDPTEGALLTLGLKAGLKHDELISKYSRHDMIPFSPDKAYMATLHSKNGKAVIYVKGAPERLFPMCSQQLDHENQQQNFEQLYWEQEVNVLAKQGERVLGVAYKILNSDETQLREDDIKSNLVFLGLIGITDLPREEVKLAIEACAHAGIAVKMITGDHALTASAIAKILGIKNSENVLTGAELEKLTDERLAEIVETTNVYARMHPKQKLRLVQALQIKKHVVAMTGDGVNDAPALKIADIGIAMGKQGTEVAKESSQLILVDDNFASIVHAIGEGRNIFQNIKRTIQFMLVTDVAEGLVLLIAMFAGFTLPITPLQILWINTVTAVTLSLGFAFAPYDRTVMTHPPLLRDAPIFSKQTILSSFFHLILITSGTIVFFLYHISHGTDVNTARTITLNILVWFEIYYLWGIFPPRVDHNVSWFKHWMPALAVSISVLILQIFFTYTPSMQKIFSVTSLPVSTWIQMICVSSLLLLWMKAEKIILNPPNHTNQTIQKGSQLLQEILESSEKETLSIGQLVELLGNRSIILLILVFSLPHAFPIIEPPGLSTVIGTPILLLGFHLLLGKKTVILPKKISEKNIPQTFLKTAIRLSLPIIKFFEKFMYPRWHVVHSPFGKRLIGFFICLMSLVLMLPIPGGNFLPGFSIAFLALAMLEADGFFCVLGMLFSAISFYLMYSLISLSVQTIIRYIQ